MTHVSEDTQIQYRELLRDFRTNKSTDPIPNRYPWQSRLAAIELLELARIRQQDSSKRGDAATIVRLLTSTLPSYVYTDKEVVWEIKEFLKLGGSMRVLVWAEALASDAITDRNSLFHIRDEFKNNLSFKVSATNRFGDQLAHCLAVDAVAYRLEAPHGSITSAEVSELSPEVPARICFNDPVGGKQLVEYFDRLWIPFKEYR